MNEIIELFGFSTLEKDKHNWEKILKEQNCPYLGKRCIKVRKSQPEISIGTCSVKYGKESKPLIICPFRLLEKKQIFTDCLHLLTTHQPGNELHIVAEVSVPGGCVDYFLVSAKENKVRDFVGIELQTLDTTGTVWPARQRFLKSVESNRVRDETATYKTFGINWKMTAKTISIQLHHKVQTFEHINKHLVLVIQDSLLTYLQNKFQFSHLTNARLGDPMQLHSYCLDNNNSQKYSLKLNTRLSTDSDGIAICLGLQAETNVELENIKSQLELKINDSTLFSLRTVN